MNARAIDFRSRRDAGILNALLWGMPTAANAAMLLFVFGPVLGTTPIHWPWLFFLIFVLFGALSEMFLVPHFPKLSPLQRAGLADNPGLVLSEKILQLGRNDRIVRGLLAQVTMLSLLAIVAMSVAG